jgi:hypothetical protein
MPRGRRSSRAALHIEIFLLLALAGMTCERGMLERLLLLSVVRNSARQKSIVVIVIESRTFTSLRGRQQKEYEAPVLRGG